MIQINMVGEASGFVLDRPLHADPHTEHHKCVRRIGPSAPATFVRNSAVRSIAGVCLGHTSLRCDRAPEIRSFSEFGDCSFGNADDQRNDHEGTQGSCPT
jgi:hypothetical protein